VKKSEIGFPSYDVRGPIRPLTRFQDEAHFPPDFGGIVTGCRTRPESDAGAYAEFELFAGYLRICSL